MINTTSHHEILHQYPHGIIEIDYELEYNGNYVTVNQILVKKDFTNTLGKQPNLEFYNGGWVWRVNYQAVVKGVVKDRIERIENDYARRVIKEILEVKKEAVRYLLTSA